MRQTLSRKIEAERLAASAWLEPGRRGKLGQFMTPAPIAGFMARLFRRWPSEVRLLDAGAGVGSLAGAVIGQCCGARPAPTSIHATLYEVDPLLVRHLAQTMNSCRAACHQSHIRMHAAIEQRDFIAAGATLLRHDRSAMPAEPLFNRVIMNPPYRKIRSDSLTRRLLRTIGIETGNLYTAFLAVAVRLMEPEGELVAITPRSFCNGSYFRPFRELFFRQMVLRRVHLFECRNRAFAGDGVLQEHVIFHAVRARKRGMVMVSLSAAPDEQVMSRRVEHDDVVWPGDAEQLVHLAVSDAQAVVAERLQALPCTLRDLGITVSTGRVVDFRAQEHLRRKPGPATVPLIYPCHFASGFVVWPKLGCRKHNALADNDQTRTLLVEQGTYTLTKRFTSKEEKRRIVAAVYDPRRVDADAVGFENHLNYYHRSGRGLSSKFARGLACYLNSSVVDTFFRQFSGHTQVNSTDLRRLPYPSQAQLERLGTLAGDRVADQEQVDALVQAELFHEFRTKLAP